MKTFFIYSSLTGNTKKLAEAVHRDISPESELYNVKDLPANIENEDGVFFIFYWNDKGTADKLSIDFMKKLKNKKVIAMGTLGTYDNGPSAKRMLDRVRDILQAGDNEVLEEFCCRGKIEVSRTLRKLQLPEGHKQRLTREDTIRHLSSHFHPNQEDFANAIKAAKNGLSKAE